MRMIDVRIILSSYQNRLFAGTNIAIMNADYGYL